MGPVETGALGSKGCPDTAITCLMRNSQDNQVLSHPVLIIS